MTKNFGLIGRNISYSFSQKYFTEKFQKLLLSNYHYRLLDLPTIEAVATIFDDPFLAGLNVTIPYKTDIISYLDALSPEAEAIGAVNCIHIKNNRRIGYNTDAFGFEKTLLLHKKSNHQSALIFGDGGAAKAVKFVLEKHNIPHQTVARKSDLNFKSLTKENVATHQILIQTTPVGTFPSVDDCLDIPFDGITSAHLCIDLIYNPEVTQFLKLAALKGAKTANGFYMLEQQAEKAWEIWNV